MFIFFPDALFFLIMNHHFYQVHTQFNNEFIIQLTFINNIQTFKLNFYIMINVNHIIKLRQLKNDSHYQYKYKDLLRKSS